MAISSLKARIAEELTASKYTCRAEEILDQFITTDPDLLTVKQKVMQLWFKTVPVLIIGETGTGKELIAQALHGDRPPDKFVAINVTAIPEELMESEFFGATRGSYSSCLSDRQGLFDAAQDGTLFLDEIGDMPLSLQAKLLRVLQSKTYRRIGETRERHTNARIIAATNRTEAELKDTKSFRLDLFFRLAVICLRLKPLRERPEEDKELLIKHFCGNHTEVVDKVREDLYRVNELHGNVRELENIVQHHIAML